MFKEEDGDIWKMDCEALCVTTNGFVRSDGSLAMGRGTARQARSLYPRFEYMAGGFVKRNGNVVQAIVEDMPNGRTIFIFPVKHKWWEKADIVLIQNSCEQLMNIAETHNYKRILLPRPGCGNGGLKWDVVKPAIQDLLDERIVVVHFTIPIIYNP